MKLRGRTRARRRVWVGLGLATAGAVAVVAVAGYTGLSLFSISYDRNAPFAITHHSPDFYSAPPPPPKVYSSDPSYRVFPPEFQHGPYGDYPYNPYYGYYWSPSPPPAYVPLSDPPPSSAAPDAAPGVDVAGPTVVVTVNNDVSVN